jgi:hypothetical protein
MYVSICLPAYHDIAGTRVIGIVYTQGVRIDLDVVERLIAVAVFTGSDSIGLFTWGFLARSATKVTPATPILPAAVGIIVKG